MDTSRLKSLPLFEGVPDEDVEKISPFVSEVSVSAGKHLVEEGDYAYEFMAIEEGTAEVRRGDRILAELGPGDFFGEMGLIDSERRNATVIAKTGLRLITLDRWDMKRLEKAIPSAAAKIRETVEKRRGT
ncbi:MAG TPA: cyclic nucleotide-binding domain-containing protein [Thermoleophilaceae bacterium]|nr:cyclic nucleotide-binding domain-containing protein [Thermoleophilaceae bacterium]